MSRDMMLFDLVMARILDEVDFLFCSPLPETAPGNRSPGADIFKSYSSKTE